MSSSRSSSSSTWEIAVSGSPREEAAIDNVKEKGNIEEEAEEFIRTFRNDLKMQRLKSLAEASAAAAAADQFKQKNSSSEIRSNRLNNVSNIQKFEKVMDVDKSAADFISKFRGKIAMERRDSLDRYKQMLDRGV